GVYADRPASSCGMTGKSSGRRTTASPPVIRLVRMQPLAESVGRAEITLAKAEHAAARAIDAVKVYGRGDTAVEALQGVTAEFVAGRFTAIMGPSGSGKSTLLHCLAGLDRLTSGEVVIGGAPLSTLDDRSLTLLRRDRIGFVFQQYNLVPTLSAWENMTLPF